ncbi:MAG: hydroxymethylbilane synthase [Xanthomonadales bacterium]|nr:hydroxymethylbilane synthase [Xanthomonadales bacterium]
MKTPLRIATRKSALALWQANHVRDLLVYAHPGIEIELMKIVTQGDRILDRPLAEIGGKGLFLKELERAMLDGEADLAVHSMKDVPASMAEGLVLDAVLPRANPYDALVSRNDQLLADLPAGSRVGTSSLRRKSQLLALRPDLEVTDLRGNVDTRLRKLDEGQYDAIILACAGLQRLGLGNRITETLQPPDWLPASTQGIIGLQCRQDDSQTRSLIKPLADSDTMVVASAERAVARVLEATCQVPLAAHAVLESGTVRLRSVVSSTDGKESIHAAGDAPAADAVALGERVAADLLNNGAGKIMAGL